jgi:NADH-quinone oxidoreductase subunit F
MERVITKHFDVENIQRLAVARQHGAYLTLGKLERMTPREVTGVVTESQLRGRGGAGFPVGKKWSMVPPGSGGPTYLIANADESEPGTFKDRTILKRDPHLVIEGMLIAAHAVGAKVAYVYFRGEYGNPMDAFAGALREARDAGIIGPGRQLEDVILYRGAGAYICGEETALIRSIEGFRGLPSEKPPYPVTSGLFGRPTVVGNVETLAALPFIIREGAERFRVMGTELSRGTKLVSVTGAVARPGVYEVEMGTPVASLIKEQAGGMQGDRGIKAILPGGVSNAVLTASEALSCTIDFESFEEAGSAMGSGAMIVIDDKTSMVKALASIARFFAHESCGQCTPCREGTGWIMRVLGRIEAGAGRPSDINLLRDLAHGMRGTALCPLAESLSVPVLSFIAKFKGEFEDAVMGW